MSSVAVIDTTNRTVPVSMFTEGRAEEVFADVQRFGAMVLKQDGITQCVMVSPEKYVAMSDAYNDMKLLEMAEERLHKWNLGISKLIPGEEFDRKFGITEKDLEGWEDIELE